MCKRWADEEDDDEDDDDFVPHFNVAENDDVIDEEDAHSTASLR